LTDPLEKESSWGRAEVVKQVQTHIEITWIKDEDILEKDPLSSTELHGQRGWCEEEGNHKRPWCNWILAEISQQSEPG
jgi:hypothetical protein